MELRGFEPLTPCMPSRNPGRWSTTKPRITGHQTAAVVVTRDVSRGLMRLQLLPRCCPPNDHEHSPPPTARRWKPLTCERKHRHLGTSGDASIRPLTLASSGVTCRLLSAGCRMFAAYSPPGARPVTWAIGWLVGLATPTSSLRPRLPLPTTSRPTMEITIYGCRTRSRLAPTERRGQR